MDLIELTIEQIPHVNKIEKIFEYSPVAFDMSMMGAGKTYTTTFLANKIGYKNVVVICPATVEAKWKEMVRYGLKLNKVISYQSLRSRKGCKPSHGLLNRIDNEDEEIIFTPTQELKRIIEEGCLFIFDEAQNIKNKNDQWYACNAISRHLIDSSGISRFIMLSGTPIDKEEHSINLMSMMGFIKSHHLYKYNKDDRNLRLYGAQELVDFCKKINYEKTNDFLRFNRFNEGNVRHICYLLFQQIVKNYITSSMSPPKNEYGINCKNGYYKLEDEEEKADLTRAINMLHDAAHYDEKSGTAEFRKDNLGSISRALMKIEDAKISTFSRIAKETLKNIPNCKIGIFVNYTSSIEKLKNSLIDYNPVLLHGTVPKEKRQKIIDKFQEPNLECRVIIANLQVGSTGIDLDDKYGNYPRVALGSPNYIIQNLHQLTFRFLRRDTKSAAIFRFVYGLCGKKETSILNALAKKSQIMKETLVEQTDADIKFPGEYDEFIEI
jgi:SNF2 family DNA or RNA helicase